MEKSKKKKLLIGLGVTLGILVFAGIITTVVLLTRKNNNAGGIPDYIEDPFEETRACGPESDGTGWCTVVNFADGLDYCEINTGSDGGLTVLFPQSDALGFKNDEERNAYHLWLEKYTVEPYKVDPDRRNLTNYRPQVLFSDDIDEGAIPQLTRLLYTYGHRENVAIITIVIANSNLRSIGVVKITDEFNQVPTKLFYYEDVWETEFPEGSEIASAKRSAIWVSNDLRQKLPQLGTIGQPWTCANVTTITDPQG